MKKIKLIVQKRELLGRKVKKLRSQGVLPANVFGKKTPSVSIQVPAEDFLKVYKEAGETQLVELDVSGEMLPVLIQNIQKHPVTEMPLHVDFLQVDLKEKIKANVPLEVSGEAPAVVEKVGVLLTLLDEVEVETLPGNVPEEIMVDVSKLAKVGDVVTAAHLAMTADVRLLTPPETELIRVDELVSKEAEALVQEEAAAQAAAEAAPAEGVEPGKEASTTEAKPAEEKAEEKKE